MAPQTLVSNRVVLPEGIRRASIVLEDGVIRAIDERAGEVHDLADHVLMPGLVDTHVHVNDPGRSDWEGFETATRAAAAGGVTTIVDMPLNAIPPTTTVPGLRAKLAAAEGRCRVDHGCWGGLVPGNVASIEPLLDAGVLGFKCFLCPSGVPEFDAVGRADLEAAMRVLARRDALLLAHAELPDRLRALTAPCRRYDSYAASRPPEAELEAIAMLIDLARRHGARVHIVHLAAAAAIEMIAAARDEGVRISCETCPHYLTFDAESAPDGATLLKCAPPIRDRKNRERLWAGLAEGVITMIVSDHSPCPPELKSLDDGDLARAWGGIASLQLGLPIVWTAARTRGFGLDDVATWMATAPARLAGLEDRKGAIRVGADADLIVVDPDGWVDPTRLEHRHPLTPYTGLALRGAVLATYLRGRLVHGDSADADTATGRWVTHGP